MVLTKQPSGHAHCNGTPFGIGATRLIGLLSSIHVAPPDYGAKDLRFEVLGGSYLGEVIGEDDEIGEFTSLQFTLFTFLEFAIR